MIPDRGQIKKGSKQSLIGYRLKGKKKQTINRKKRVENEEKHTVENDSLKSKYKVVNYLVLVLNHHTTYDNLLIVLPKDFLCF